MKAFSRSINAVLLAAVFFFLLFSVACKKDNDDNNDDKDIFLNENWLVGTWEATTPVTGDTMFDNKKIRLVIDQVALKATDTVPNNVVKLWLFSGTLSWDLDAIAPWSMRFYHNTYPSGVNSFGWQSATMYQADVTINNISLRIGDSVDMQPNPEYDFDLDWGPYNDYTRVAPTLLDFYGDIEIYKNGEYYDADYPPEAGKMIRFTKK
jgi:hypothetical protein